MKNVGEYRPDYAVPPGWILEERLELLEWSQAEFALRCGRSAKLISEIISGKAPVEPDTALQFEKVLDLDAVIWLNLECNYQLHLARKRENERLKKAVQWYRRFPIKNMIKEGLFDTPVYELGGVKSLLEFFGVGTLKAFENKIGAQVTLARHTTAFNSTNEAVSVWLRFGELVASSQECGTYDVEKFKKELRKIRRLTCLEPEKFHPKMTEICNKAGVAFVLNPPLPGNKLSGATWWLNRKTPVIQLTLRGKWNDIYWFNFFHEAAHILLHSRKDTFIDEDRKNDSKIENEANTWARNFLIPEEEWDEYVWGGIFTYHSIREFAAEQGIAPAIVLGRLQFENKVGWRTSLNSRLKERYKFAG